MKCHITVENKLRFENWTSLARKIACASFMIDDITNGL